MNMTFESFNSMKYLTYKCILSLVSKEYKNI